MIGRSAEVTVAIVGGGFSGGAVAAHLAGNPAFCGRIVVFEPRDHLGRGLAYDTDDDAHRVNVPASRMSLAIDDDDHFMTWLTANDEVGKDPGALAADGKLYPHRGVFGRYVSDFIAPFIRSGLVQHVKSRVTGVRKDQGRWLVSAENGVHLRADILVIAASHPSPHAPAGFDRALAGHPRYVPDPTVAGSLSVIRPDDRVLVVGAGLTSADVVSSLALHGHHGAITVFSRRGLRSRGHSPVVQDPFGDFSREPALTATRLLRRVRQSIAEAQSQGLTWHAVFDALRAQGGPIWQALPLPEKRRLVRHLRPFWDAHRFRIAPQVGVTIDKAVESGRLRFLAASVAHVEQNGEAVTVALKHRGTGVVERIDVDAVVITTGPAHGDILSSQGWLGALAGAGLLSPDPAGLGLSCDRESHALDKRGGVVANLFISGPLARGTFGELMGLPQVNEHAVLVAEGIARMVDAVASRPYDADSIADPWYPSRARS